MRVSFTSLISALLLAACGDSQASTLTSTNTKAKLPASLDCRAVKSFDENGQETATSQYSFELRKLTSSKPTFDGNSGIIENEQGSVIVDFGVRAHGGDQYSSFTFSAADVAAFAKGKIAKLSAVYESGYDWADGDHITKDILECVKP